MAAEQAALRRRIAQKRQEIADDLDRLNREVRNDYQSVQSMTSPANVVRRMPVPALGLALGAGLLAGLWVANLLVVPRLRVHLFGR